MVLKGSVFSYSQGFRFIWDEIKVVFTTTSDCRLAKEMLLRVTKAAIGDYVVDYTKRSALKDQLFTTIVEEVANSDGRLE
jgi:hypothetical protein